MAAASSRFANFHLEAVDFTHLVSYWNVFVATLMAEAATAPNDNLLGPLDIVLMFLFFAPRYPLTVPTSLGSAGATSWE